MKLSTIPPPSSSETSNATTFTATNHMKEAQESLNRATAKFENGELSALEWLKENEHTGALLAQLDSTGAFIAEMFNVELGQLFAERAITFDTMGLMQLKRSDANTFVTMYTHPVLPWINAQGGHDAGDFALEATVSKIEAGLDKTTTSRGVHHLRGGDFSAVVKTQENSNIFEAFNEMHNKKLPVVPNTAYLPELTYSAISIEDAVGIFNQLQMIRALKGPENMILSEKQAQKDIVGIMKAFLELDKETQKADILIRFAIDAARKNLDFENIYNNFIKLYFTNTNYAAMFEKWDKFKEAVNFIAQNKTEVASLISEIAIIAGKNALLEEIETNPAAEDVINASLKLVRPKKEELEVAQEVLVATRATLLNDFIDLSKTNGFIQQIQKSRMSQESGYLNKTGFRYTKTWHKQQIDAINETFAQAQASLEAMESSEYTEDDVKTIQKLIDLSDLEAYIQNIGPTIDAEKVMSQLDRALLSRDTTIIRKFIDFTQERVARFNRQYDTKLTGLPTRFKFYEQSNALVTEAENTGENHSIYFVDLGYLGGYFNKKGNRATGDEALAVAVSQIEQKLAEYFGNESWQEAVQVFRYGGDELMLTVRNGNESAVLIQKLFLELNAQGEKVKAVGRVGPTYVPERIQYNAARCDVNLGKKILQEMIGKEIFSPEEEKMLSDDYMNREFYVKTLARVMTTTADKYCSYRKTYDRFEKLWADYIAITKAEEKGENMEKEREHLRDMLDASSKALEGVDFDIFEQCSNYIAVHNKATGWEAFTTVLESYNKGKNLLKSVEDIESGKFNEITERLIEDMVKDAGARRKVMEQRVSTIV